MFVNSLVLFVVSFFIQFIVSGSHSVWCARFWYNIGRLTKRKKKHAGETKSIVQRVGSERGDNYLSVSVLTHTNTHCTGSSVFSLTAWLRVFRTQFVWLFNSFYGYELKLRYAKVRKCDQLNDRPNCPCVRPIICIIRTWMNVSVCQCIRHDLKSTDPNWNVVSWGSRF